MTGTRIQKDTLESARSECQMQLEKWYFDDDLPPTPDVLKPLEDDGEKMSEKYCEVLDLNVGTPMPMPSQSLHQTTCMCWTYMVIQFGRPSSLQKTR